jgi:hypothetical protein
MNNNFGEEQEQLVDEVWKIRNQKLGSKRTGNDVCILVKNYIERHLPIKYKIVGPNVFVVTLPIEYDLLIVRTEASLNQGAYGPSDVQVVLEIKTAGIRARKQEYPKAIENIKNNFSSIKRYNAKVWGALIMISGTIRTARSSSIQYEDLRKEGLEPFGFGVYTLSQGHKPEIGKWGAFIIDLVDHLSE